MTGRTAPFTLPRSEATFSATRGATTAFDEGVETVALVTRYSAGTAAFTLIANEPSPAGLTPRFIVHAGVPDARCSSRRPGRSRPSPVNVNGVPYLIVVAGSGSSASTPTENQLERKPSAVRRSEPLIERSVFSPIACTLSTRWEAFTVVLTSRRRPATFSTFFSLSGLNTNGPQSW